MATDWRVVILLVLLFVLYLVLAWMSLSRSGRYVLSETWAVPYRGPYRTVFSEYVQEREQVKIPTRVYLKYVAKVVFLMFGIVALRCTWERRVAILPIYWEAE